VTARGDHETFPELAPGGLWERLADPGAAPGGGSAAGVAAWMAAALVVKAARHSVTTWPDAAGVAAQAGSLAERCSELAVADAIAFAAALEALASREQVELALSGTVGELLALGEAAADVAELAARTAERCDGTFRGDAVAGALLAEAAARGAAALVAANLTVPGGDERLLRARRTAEAAADAGRRALHAGP
jgi:formiminotetrahydrofolate cyclodeaminase